jgi:hypothetical protein
MEKHNPNWRCQMLIRITVFILCAVLLVGCAAGPNPNRDTPRSDGREPAGFWLGLWHGMIAFFAFIVSLFKPSVGIYETHNTGFWYNFGFIIGIMGSHGGGAGIVFKGNQKRKNYTNK